MTYDITSALLSTPVRTPETLRSASTASGDAVTGTPQARSGGQSLPPDTQPPAAKLDQVVKQLNEYAQAINREVQFSIDKDSGRTLIKVVDSKTMEVIRQIPSEEVLSLDRNLARNEGLVFRAKA